MKAFFAAVALAIIIAVGAVYLLDGWQRPADRAFASATGVRIPDHGVTTNLVGSDWRSFVPQ
jgi:hypothetical protein